MQHYEIPNAFNYIELTCFNTKDNILDTKVIHFDNYKQIS